MPFAEHRTAGAVPITPVACTGLNAVLAQLDDLAAAWVEASGFEPRPGKTCLIPTPGGSLARVLVGVETSDAPGGGLWDLAGLPAQLPKGVYWLDAVLSAAAGGWAALGWALGHYQFDRYRKKPKSAAHLVWPENADKADILRLMAGIGLVRDLINTPAGDLGPADLAEAAEAMAKSYDARVSVIVGEDLLRHNYPSVHAVGRAAAQPPRLIDIRWGETTDPRVTLIGKGVCFDSGGLDIKPSGGMRLMKKDMGGAAQVLGLARIIMDAHLPVCLRVLVPAVENAISGNAFRPLDVLQTRKGLTVEVGNTDAEGRLILSDALAEAATENPDMIIDFATLTGAARVALGPDVPALFSNDDALANALLRHAGETADPLWRMPLWQPYNTDLESPVADVSSTGTAPQGGAIKAALFLERFVEPGIPWAHIDLMAYNSSKRPGRPEGGEAMGIRAVYAMLKARYG